jgi:hypothetical protein
MALLERRLSSGMATEGSPMSARRKLGQPRRRASHHGQVRRKQLSPCWCESMLVKTRDIPSSAKHCAEPA